MPALGAAYVVIRASLVPLKAGLNLAKTMVMKAMAMIAGIVRKMTEKAWKYSKRLALGITGAITGSVWAFGRFEKAMRKATAVSDVTGGQFIKMSKMARKYAIELNVSAKELASGFYYLGSAGLSASQQLDAFVPVAKMAKALTQDMGSAAERTVDIMKGFNIGFEKTEYVTDVLTKTVTSSNQVFGQLGDALSYVAGVARMFNNTLEDTNAALMIMADVGIKGAKAGVVMRRALTNLAAPTSQIRAKMDEFGISIYDSITGKMKPFVQLVGEIGDALKDASEEQRNMVFNILFGKRAIAGQIAIFDKGSVALRELADSLRDAGGATEKVVGVQLNAFLEQLGRLQKIVTDSAMVFGNALAPALRLFTDDLQKSAMQFNKWVRSHKYDIMEWAGVILTRVNLVRRVLFDFSKWVIQNWPDVWRYAKEIAVKNWDAMWRIIKVGAMGGMDTVYDIILASLKSTYSVFQKVFLQLGADIGFWVAQGLLDAKWTKYFPLLRAKAFAITKMMKPEPVDWEGLAVDFQTQWTPVLENSIKRIKELKKLAEDMLGDIAEVPKPAGWEDFKDSIKDNIKLMDEEMAKFREMIKEMKNAENASQDAINKAIKAADKGGGAAADIMGGVLTGKAVGVKEAWSQTMANIHQKNLMTSMDRHLANIESNTEDLEILGTVTA